MTRPFAPPAPSVPASGLTPPVLTSLRHATAAAHARLDSGMPLSRPDAGLTDYAEHAQLLLAWMVPIEAWLARFSDGPQDPRVLSPRWRSGVLVADLAEPCLQPVLHRVPPCPTPTLPALDPDAPIAVRWGMAYVLEGAQLGGHVLHRRLSERLSPHPLRHLRGDAWPVADAPAGAAVGARWRQVVAALGAQVRSEGDIALACAGAVQGFERLLALLQTAHRQSAPDLRPQHASAARPTGAPEPLAAPELWA